FFEGRYRRAGDAAFLDLDAGASISVPARPVADGFDLTIGIRPEHVLVGEAARPGAPVCPVELVEPTGVGAILHVRFGEAPLKAFHLGRTALRSGESVAVSLPPEKLLLFDTKTGRRLDD
ncbi:TOBE domain-containing protein, partial [Aureimonas sp. Leaf460]|uniref:TOBE domain-containing protein n=2 Tax=unclassified Aureimonas TaxID=2615206 RepID=UPI00138EF42A